MQVLFDNGVPRGVASVLKEHVVEEARDRGWDRLTNGDLLSAAEAAGFEILVTTDRNIRHQQNLSKRVIAVVVLSKGSWPLIRKSCARSLPPLMLQPPAATPRSRFLPIPILAATDLTAIKSGFFAHACSGIEASPQSTMPLSSTHGAARGLDILARSI